MYSAIEASSEFWKTYIPKDEATYEIINKIQSLKGFIYSKIEYPIALDPNARFLNLLMK